MVRTEASAHHGKGLVRTGFSVRPSAHLISSIHGNPMYGDTWTRSTKYCKPKYFSDLTIIAMIATRRKHYISDSSLCYIQAGRKWLKILGVIINNTAYLSKNAIIFCPLQYSGLQYCVQKMDHKLKYCFIFTSWSCPSIPGWLPSLLLTAYRK